MRLRETPFVHRTVRPSASRATYAVVLFAIAAPLAGQTAMAGNIGSSPTWGSGWIDLATVTDFSRGDRLRITVGGTAARLLVRLLPNGVGADQPQFIIGGVHTVPQDRVVELTLDTDYKGIVQISVHGGTNPWNVFRDPGNGPATLEGVVLVADR